MKPLLERTEDSGFLRSVVTNPRCWRWVGEGDPQDYVPVIHPDIHYFGWSDGFFAFKRVESGLFEAHVCAPGTVTQELYFEALRLLSCSMSVVKVFALVHQHKRHAVKFAKSVGFSCEGRLVGAYMHRGRMKDMILLGMTPWAPH